MNTIFKSCLTAEQSATLIAKGISAHKASEKKREYTDLGKQKETVTQEEIEKVAKESADNVINGYRIDDILRDDLRDDMINLFKDAIAALGKREKGDNK